MKIFLVVFLMPLLSFTCNRDSAGEGETFSFGISHCMCPSGCVKNFQIRNKQLFADKMEKCSDPQQYESTPLPNDKYQLAKSLLENFPAYLLGNPDKTFGCPDCLDQGSINIELKDNTGRVRYWHIDTRENTQPLEIQAYIKQLVAIVGQL